MDGGIVKSGLETVKTEVQGKHFTVYEERLNDTLSMAEMQRHQVHTFLHELQVLLVPASTEYDTHEAQLASYRVLLANTFGDDDVQATLPDLEDKTEYLQWRASENSCILRLNGVTNTAQTGLCWLSNIVPGLVEDLRLEGQPVAFHLTQSQQWMQDGVPLQEIISSILFQLLQIKSRTLSDRKRLDELHRMLERDAWCSGVTSICKTLVTVLEEFEVASVILDRLDRGVCSGQVPRFVERLLEALCASTCRARVLIVTESAYTTHWEVELSEEMKRKCMYLEIAQWDQEVLTPRRRRML